MAKVIFKSYNPNDNLLLPPCLGDYLPQNHPARVVSAIVEKLDISEIESDYKGGGTSSYNPKMLLKVMVYAYLNNVYSGRQMEKLLVENIAHMWLSRMQPLTSGLSTSSVASALRASLTESSLK